MKTKIIGMILIAILAVYLIGCGLGKPNRESEVQIPEDAFEYNGVIVSVKDKNMDNVFAAFGEPEKKEGDSPGFFYVFDSGQVDVTSYIINQINEEEREEFPCAIFVRDENIKTAREIHVGSTVEEVKAAYGEKEIESDHGETVLSYSFEDFTIDFYLDGTVTQIRYA